MVEQWILEYPNATFGSTKQNVFSVFQLIFLPISLLIKSVWNFGFYIACRIWVQRMLIRALNFSGSFHLHVDSFYEYMPWPKKLSFDKGRNSFIKWFSFKWVLMNEISWRGTLLDSANELVISFHLPREPPLPLASLITSRERRSGFQVRHSVYQQKRN